MGQLPVGLGATRQAGQGAENRPLPRHLQTEA